MIYRFEKMMEEDVQAIQLSCCQSYLFYNKSLYYQEIVEHLLTKTGGRWEKAVRWFVSNGARALRKKANGFKISLNPQTYSGNTMGIGFKGVKGFLEWAEQRSYIHIYKGCVLSWKVEEGKRSPDEVVPTCVVFRERFLSLWLDVEEYDIFKEVERQSAVCVRDRSSKEELNDYEDYLEEDRIRMLHINDSLNDSTIAFNGKRIATPEYRRIYTDNVFSGGRLYVQGGGVQLLPQEMRSKHLEIDGEKVVELDYSSIHPNICYQLLHNKGIPVREIIGEDFKPYGADLRFIQVNQEKKEAIEKVTGDVHDPLRNLAKLAILIGMNSKDVSSAVSAMSSKVHADRKKEWTEQKFYAIDGKIPVSDILRAVCDHNDFISENFFSDVGIILQKYDSDIALKVIESVIQSGSAVLAYHDSFIVKESVKDVLRQAMVDAWYDVFTDTTFCKVEEK